MSLFHYLFGRQKNRSDDFTAISKENCPDGFRWGNAFLSLMEALGNFLAVGAPGSGKSVIIQLFLQSFVKRMEQDKNTRDDGNTGQDKDSEQAKGMRLVIKDAKQNLPSLLAAIAPGTKVIISNPFDRRCRGWAMWKDIRTAGEAIQAAFHLAHGGNDTNVFFVNASRHILYGVMASFILSDLEWTLADVIRAVKNPTLLRRILKRHPQTADIVKQYFRNPRVLADIISSLATMLLPLEPIAACWSHAEFFSIREWISENSILVLGESETCRTAMQAVNSVIFKVIVDLILSLPDSRSRLIGVILDELAECGKLNGLPSLLKKGRSKGAVTCIATQSISGLRDNAMYGQHVTDDLLGQIAHRFIGRTECVATAEWLSSLFADYEGDLVTRSFTTSSQGGSYTENHQMAVRKLVLPGEIMSIPTCDIENGLTGYFFVRPVGVFKDHIAAEQLFGEDLIPPDPAFVDLERRDPADEFLMPWTKEEVVRFAGKRSRPSRAKEKREIRPEPTRNARSNDLELGDQTPYKSNGRDGHESER
jgi:hypothetical protein